MKKRLSVLFISLIILLFSFSTPAIAATESELKGAYEFNLVARAAQFISKYYKFGTTNEEMMSAALFRKMIHPEDTVEDLLDEMLSSLDEHSQYMYKEDYEQMLSHTVAGEFVGIGVSIHQSNGRIIVVSPIKGSPAEAAGILPNDVLVSVNGEDISSASVDYAQSLIMGDVGTLVNIGVLRGGKLIDFEIMRAKIKEVSVASEILDGNIGYISVANFNGSTVEETKTALAEFDKNNVQKVIIDLRYNPGGELNSAIGFCNLFVPKGVVASVQYRDESKNESFYSELEHPKYKLALLVNKGSASAAELFSAAVQDTKVGKLFGTTTYGKGTMQTLFPFSPTGGALKITTAEYFSAGGNPVNGVGVSPDYSISNKTVTKDCSYFVPIDFNAVVSDGTNSEAVLAIEQRLEFLGYFDGEPDSLFDKETSDSLLKYQTYRNINATGTADFATLFDLNNVEYEELLFTDDRQFDAAYEYLKGLK
ncbi:MAG: S41 family peptidase [Clostridia bacterium]|nr:S41 family peptidase [Clostridia bacterium]